MKEIWIRVLEEEEQNEVMDKFLSFDDALFGSIPVILYCSANNTKRRLPFAYALSDAAVEVLKGQYGTDNVKLVTRRSTDELLEQIGDSLSGIQKSLEVLTGCISTSQEGRKLCISGDITKYEP